MAGIIREARSIYKALEKVKKDQEKLINVQRDCGRDVSKMPSPDEVLNGRLGEQLEEFRKICEIAVQLRDIAEETGLIRTGHVVSDDNPKLDGKYAMITIRPKDGAYTLEEFHLYLLTYLKKPYFLGGVYAFEQLGTDILTIGKGWHVHIVCKLKPYVQFQELKRDLEKCMPGKLGETYTLQVGESDDGGKKKRVRKFLERRSDLEYALNYLDGDKHDDSKDAAVSLNTQWRLAMDLEDRFTWGEKVDFRMAITESSTGVGDCIVEEAD